MNSIYTNNQIEQEVALFFRHYALSVLQHHQVDTTDKRAVKQTLIAYYEQIYPAFSKTKVFEYCFEKAQHNVMVEAYKKNFLLLLQGVLPTII